MIKTVLASACAAAMMWAGPALGDLRDTVEADYDHIEALYKHLHANPEMSLMEVRTAARLAEEWRAAGFTVTEGVGGTGVVAVLENGPGPIVMLRADMDGLPVEEKTGLDYASTVVGENRFGETQPVMHACGHDIHMASATGAARLLAAKTDEWSGTLVMIAQPAEEIGYGAKQMLDDGLYDRFPLPDYVVALHVNNKMPAGYISYTPGWALANVDSIDMYVKGVGGHGSAPHTAKDPIMISAQIITALQTLVSRETDPLKTAVVTVGAIHGGLKHNIISDEVHLQLTVRSYDDDVRQNLLDGIKRIAAAQAASAGLPEELWPRVEIDPDYAPSTYNDPELTHRLAGVFIDRFGADRVNEAPPITGGEDFSWYGRTDHDIPTLIFWVGGADEREFRKAQREGRVLPQTHSPYFAPLPEPTLKTGVEAMTAAALHLFGEQVGQ